jgi:hypothetical protein
MLTMGHGNSSNEGYFLTLRDFLPEGSTVNAQDLLIIDADGGIGTMSGTTLKMELNSSGLYAGSTQIISTAGVFQKTLVVASTGTTLVEADIGKLVVVTTAGTTALIRLPASGMSAGWNCQVMVNSTAAGDVTVLVLGTTGPIFHFHSGTTNTLATTKAAVTWDTSGTGWIEAVCISTVEPIYAISNKMAHGSTTLTSVYYKILEGTTTT